MLNLLRRKKATTNDSVFESHDEFLKVHCDVTYSYHVDESKKENRVTYTWGCEPLLIEEFVAYCHLNVSYRLEDEDTIYQLKERIKRCSNKDLDELYLTIKEDLDGNALYFIKGELEEMIGKEILSRDSKSTKEFIQNNKDLKLVFTLDIKK